ncbi:hypothetical protein F4777DRAFT_531444 [Nemania sp. FL0916]|nr:hypothetical protein F4777DRAFT_531444 [Nemania sp. FL0916]
MSGFEVVGVVLGTIPLLISALEHYERGINTIQIMRRRAKVMHSLATSLSTEQTILRNTCETLLRGIVRYEDMAPLLADPLGPLWQDPDIKARVERRLDHTLEDFEAQVYFMKGAVEELRSKLCLSTDLQVKINDEPMSKRDMVKIAVQFSTHEDSLKRLAETNQKLDLLMNGNLRNEPYRKVHSQEKLFDLLQAVSKSIYNALKASLSCTCAQSHGIGFGAPMARAMGRTQDIEALVKRLNFRLVLANQPRNAKGKAQNNWVWNELVLRLGEVPMKESTPPVNSGAANAVMKNPKRVKFWDTVTPVIRIPSPLKRGRPTTERSFVEFNQITTDPAENILPPSLEIEKVVQVKDICYTLSSKSTNAGHWDPYWYLLDETTSKQRRFELFPFKSSDDNDEYTFVHLKNTFSQGHRPSLPQKYHIVAATAFSVLFLHNTRWMPALPTIEDVFLISRYEQVEFNDIYLTGNPLRDSEGSAAASNNGPSSETTGESTLLYLGILLMEIMLWKPVSRFWDDEKIDFRYVPLKKIFDRTTARGSARIREILLRTEENSTPEFRKVVERCIKCDFNTSSLSLDDETFRQAVYNDVVLPLQDADQIVNRKMLVGKANSLRI